MDNNILLVTGASSDVGTQFIKKVYNNYSKIWAHYNNSIDLVRDLRNSCGENIVPIQADFLSEKSTNEFINKIEESGDYPNHVLHLSSLKAKNKQFHKNVWNNYQKGIDTSLRSIVLILEKFIPYMLRNKYGKIVFMLSSYVIGIPPKNQSDYITLKYALMGLMRNLSSEYADKGIMINAVSPDMMETKFLSELPELIIENNANKNPLGRNICVNEVVPTIEYLFSYASDLVTGQNIAVTGGAR